MGALAKSFDYNAIDEIARDDVRDAAVRIKVRMARTAADIIDIGKDLIAVKSALGHGHFLSWIEAEFGMTDRTARRMISAAQRFDKSDTMSNFDASALYALAAPSTPDKVVAEVVERTEAGEKFTAADIQALKDAHRTEKQELASRIDSARDKAARAEAIKSDFEQQVADLQVKLREARANADVLSAELANAEAKPGDAYTQWIWVMESLWSRASEDWRRKFLANVA